MDRKDLLGVPEFVLARIPQPENQPRDRFTLVTDQSVMGDVLKNARNGAVRRKMYVAGNSVAAENVQVGRVIVCLCLCLFCHVLYCVVLSRVVFICFYHPI